MAAILQLLLGRQIQPAQLIEWLSAKKEGDDLPTVLQDFTRVRQEFVPYFLNYLRDQTGHLSGGCRSTNASPVKTPTGFKAKGQNSFPAAVSKTATSTPKPSGAGRLNRTQLFAASPLESKQNQSLGLVEDDSLSFTLDSPRQCDSSYNKSFSLDSSRNDSSLLGSAPRKSGGGNLYHSQVHDAGNSSGSRQGKGSSNSEHSQRSKHRHSLAEFLLTPENDQRRRKSPLCFRDRDGQKHSPNMGRRSGGKGQKNDKKITPRAITEQELSTPPPVFRLDSSDFPSLGNRPSSDLPKVPALPEGVRVVTASRRITPTPLHSQTSSTGPKVFRAVTTTLCKEDSTENSKFQASGVFQGRALDNPPSLEEERKLLREQKAKIGDRTTPIKGGSTPLDPCGVLTTPTKPSLERLFSVPEITRASRSEVTHEDKLGILVEVYSCCIEEQLVPNLTVELYFLVQLLTTKGSDNILESDFMADYDEVQYFQSVHNAVYFAITVLHKQKRLVCLLDKGTLRLLADNHRLAEFDLDLKIELNSIIEHNHAKSRPLNPPSPIGGVSFQADTDNRQNFPSDRSFQLFKKQRDTFYELLREWQENHLTPGWLLPEVQGSRIQALVASKVELTNHIHFTRLFQSQLIQMCRGDYSLKSEGDDEHITLLTQLKQTNPEKFKRLQERFIMPSSVGGPCPLPAFPGCQEFFHDFIIAASSHAFNQHLINTLAAKIAELNNLQITPVELESDVDELVVEQEDREHLARCLLTLRLLAKFLGFVTFLPYHSPERLPDTMHATYLSIRNQLAQPVDILVYLKAAQVSGRTALTVPWVVEFLSQMDRLAPELQYFQLVCLLLTQIHRSASYQFRKSGGSLSQLLVIVVLGWLFELPVFPEGLFFKTAPTVEEDTTLSVECIDRLDVVDQSILYSCCPYLGEVRNLLIGFAVGTSSRSSNIRKITPLTTDTEVSGTITDKQLQFQLEENFFHNHPASLKRTVDFVGDRVASNHIKIFRAQVLPSLLGEATKFAGSLAKKLHKQEQDSRVKRRLMSQLEDKCLQLAEQGRLQGCSTATGYSLEKCASILPTLLPEETAAEVVSLATQISSRIAQDKVTSWMASHITKSMVYKEAVAEFERQLRQQNARALLESKLDQDVQGEPPKQKTKTSAGSAPQVAALVHDMLTPSPSDVLIELKDMLHVFLSPGCRLGVPDILKVLKTVNAMVKNRQDVIPPVSKTLVRMTEDLAYCLVLQYPWLWQEDVEHHLVSLWNRNLSETTSFSNVLCAKHMYFLQYSTHPKESWQALTRFLIFLLREDLVKASELESSCLSRIQAFGQQETLNELAECICNVAESYCEMHKGPVESGSVFREALEWLFQLTDCLPKTQARVQQTRQMVEQAVMKLNQAHEEIRCVEHLNSKETVMNMIHVEKTPSKSKDESSGEGTKKGVTSQKEAELIGGLASVLEELPMSSLRNTSADTTLSSEGTITSEQVPQILSISNSPVPCRDPENMKIARLPGDSCGEHENFPGRDCDVEISNCFDNNNTRKKWTKTCPS